MENENILKEMHEEREEENLETTEEKENLEKTEAVEEVKTKKKNPKHPLCVWSFILSLVFLLFPCKWIAPFMTMIMSFVGTAKAGKKTETTGKGLGITASILSSIAFVGKIILPIIVGLIVLVALVFFFFSYLRLGKYGEYLFDQLFEEIIDMYELFYNFFAGNTGFFEELANYPGY